MLIVPTDNNREELGLVTKVELLQIFLQDGSSFKILVSEAAELPRKAVTRGKISAICLGAVEERLLLLYRYQ